MNGKGLAKMKMARQPKLVPQGGIWGEAGSTGFSYRIGRQQPKTLSYEYMYKKANMLSAWLNGAGVAWQGLDIERIKEIESLGHYFDTIDKVEDICRMMRIECHVMMHKELIGLEGSTVLWKRTGQRRIIEQGGAFIKYHYLKLPDRKQSFIYVRPWDDINALIEYI